jgi:soluble lytic murein transglycosylase
MHWLKPPAIETAYRGKVQALIAPLLASAPSAEAASQLKEALKAKSLAAADALADPVAKKLVQWQAMRSGVGTPEELGHFIADNPAWPDAQLIARRAEEQLFTRGGSSTQMRAFFKGREPVSGAGLAALASALLAEGDEAAARRYAARAWTDEELPATLEAGFLERFGKLLGPADHRRRLDRILVDRLRFAAERRERAAIARRVIPLLPEGERKTAEARLAVFLKDKGAGKLMAALPADPSPPSDWGLAFSRAAHHLDTGQLEEAARLLTNIPDDAEKLVSPDDWWLLRREAAFSALTAGKTTLAYELVKHSGPLSVNPLKEQCHMAGFIALRLLGKPEMARAHFEAGLKAADGPLSRARSAYWSGRTLEALGKKSEAKDRYALAMRDPDTFHGLLARQTVAGSRRTDLTIAMPALPTAEEAGRFAGLDAARAAVLARKAGLDRNIVVGLFASLRNYLKTEGEMALLAELAASLGDAQTSLRVGKAAIARGLNLMVYAYPISAFPEYEPIRPPPETALLLGVARQETEFNTQIISTAGARGLLQVMPVTARHVCAQHKVKCDLPRLLTDHAYNARIASAYIADRMAELGGWYTVSLAAYNAGPGRARQWMRENGDPRTAGVDALDWMERIPIEETRQYVEKVLANIQVYRARLGEPSPLRLVEDLTSATGRQGERTANE